MTRLNQPKMSFFVFFIVLATGAWAELYVNVTPPQLLLSGALAGYDPAQLNAAMNGLADDIETQIAGNPEVLAYTNLPTLGSGFANAGSATAQEGFLRGAHDIKVFSISLGTAAAVTLPSLDFLQKVDSADFIQDEGDIYAGIATQPLNITATVNLGFLVSGLRGMAKIGYADIDEGTLGEGFAFNSLSVGGGLSYMLIDKKSIPLGVVRWRGLAVAGGLYYQRNRADLSVTDSSFTAASTPITTGDIGLGGASVIGTLTTTPNVIASIESSTFTIPLQVTTGIRLLYIVDFNVGGGVDIVFGESVINLESTQDVNFVVDPAYAGQVAAVPGSIKMINKTGGEPDFARPHLMASLGFVLGPVHIEVPLKYYFDQEGNTYVTGLTLGVML